MPASCRPSWFLICTSRILWARTHALLIAISPSAANWIDEMPLAPEMNNLMAIRIVTKSFFRLWSRVPLVTENFFLHGLLLHRNWRLSPDREWSPSVHASESHSGHLGTPSFQRACRKIS